MKILRAGQHRRRLLLGRQLHRELGDGQQKRRRRLQRPVPSEPSARWPARPSPRSPPGGRRMRPGHRRRRLLLGLWPPGAAPGLQRPVAVDASGALAGDPLSQISAGLGATCALATTARPTAGATTLWRARRRQHGSSVVPVAVDNRRCAGWQDPTQITAGGNTPVPPMTPTPLTLWREQRGPSRRRSYAPQSAVPGCARLLAGTYEQSPPRP